MRYDPERDKLVCDFCHTEMDIQPEEEDLSQPAQQGEASLEGFHFEQYAKQAQKPDAEALPIYNCPSCGAELITPKEAAALTCPYCRNNIVMTNQVSGSLRPDGILPFRITAKMLPAAMQQYYKDKILLPRNFFSDSTMGNITGVYVPFWLFSGTISGSLNYRARRSAAVRQGDYIVTTTSHYDLNRDVSMAFENLPVDASGRIDDALMDSLEPFDMSDLRPFDMNYMAGFTADRFDKTAEDIASKAESRMKQTAYSVANTAASAGYEGAVRTGGSLQAVMSQVRYVLLPVYLFQVSHAGKNYSFAVNGQSGKIMGEIPTDKGVQFRHFLKYSLPAVGLILLASVVSYLMGR